MSKKQVLFLCTGNSCRSQIAEGLVNHFLGEQWGAHSAGTQPAGYVHPLAIQVLLEMGIDISEQRSKSVDEFRNVHFDLVVTVCDDAAENCPIWLPAPGAQVLEGGGRGVHIGFPDPAQATGSHSEQLHVFRQIRDAIRKQVLEYLDKESQCRTHLSHCQV
jgi:arsenate reductase